MCRNRGCTFMAVDRMDGYCCVCYERDQNRRMQADPTVVHPSWIEMGLSLERLTVPHSYVRQERHK